MPSLWQKFSTSLSPARVPILAAAPTQITGVEISTENAVQKETNAGRLSLILTNQMSVVPWDNSEDDLEKGDIKVLSRSLSNSFVNTIEPITKKPRKNILDIITKAAGSNYVFFVMMLILVAWVVLGIVNGTTDNWQIIMQNAGSIQIYITDILLLRQQSNARKALLYTLAEIQSRNLATERLIRQIPDCQWMETHKAPLESQMSNGRNIEEEMEEQLLMEIQQMTRIKYVWSRICHAVAFGLGSLYAYIFYWVGIFVWIAIGPLLDFSDTWQLYVNTATAVALTFTSVFLQNIQQQQEDNLELSLTYASNVDAEVEEHLRNLTGDSEPNTIFSIPAPKITFTERFLDYFADVMGSGVGVSISVVVFGAWIFVGHLLNYDDNWFLIIGTFTGLVGFVVGFVLRNVYSREKDEIITQFEAIAQADEKIFDLLNLPHLEVPIVVASSISTRLSKAAGDFSALPHTSMGSIYFTLILIIIASILKWSETGQLLCNTPTMIIEGFLLLILIQAHNMSNTERGREFSGILKRRLLLKNYVLSLKN